MPVMSGIEATREIRALERRRAGKHKPAFIIALTGLAAGSDREEAFNAGVDAFMVKPVSFKDLEKMLKQHVREGVRDAERWGLLTGIVSVESERGKNIEIKKQVISASVEALRYDDDER
jgi:DNA-binding response OmpR family regulator